VGSRKTARTLLRHAAIQRLVAHPRERPPLGADRPALAVERRALFFRRQLLHELFIDLKDELWLMQKTARESSVREVYRKAEEMMKWEFPDETE